MFRHALVRTIVGFLFPVLCGCQVDSFYIENATLAEIEDHRLLRDSVVQKNERLGLANEYFVITGHRIISDGGIVFGHRLFSSGAIPLLDQASFQKLSIYIPFSVTDQRLNAISIKENKDVFIFWSKGPSNFPRGSGCYGYATDGHVTFMRISDEEISAELNITIDTVSPGGWKKDCDRLELMKTISFKKKLASALTPWEGRQGTHVYDESIR